MSIPLPTHAQVIIAGGGIAGCSAAYHLTQLGCTDVILLEQGSLPAALPGMPPAWSGNCAPTAA
ncbi:glucose inhibited division A family protein [Collimonas fungivorans]|uniref:Glucose inhibited division A family protein n=1 Tax=Collimonas fungivorans TaxID=158899 RepID=A0A127P718_9BURK|nr:FAD-dependent oxidoreductase [Collimonas fungivorans]AMO93589.1 glucose inhibited division A family protein [Collimonas fungivorans]